MVPTLSPPLKREHVSLLVKHFFTFTWSDSYPTSVMDTCLFQKLRQSLQRPRRDLLLGSTKQPPEWDMEGQKVKSKLGCFSIFNFLLL